MQRLLLSACGEQLSILEYHYASQVPKEQLKVLFQECHFQARFQRCWRAHVLFMVTKFMLEGGSCFLWQVAMDDQAAAESKRSATLSTGLIFSSAELAKLLETEMIAGGCGGCQKTRSFQVSAPFVSGA